MNTNKICCEAFPPNPLSRPAVIIVEPYSGGGLGWGSSSSLRVSASPRHNEFNFSARERKDAEKNKYNYEYKESLRVPQLARRGGCPFVPFVFDFTASLVSIRVHSWTPS